MDRSGVTVQLEKPLGWVLFYFNTQISAVASHPHVIVPNEPEYVDMWRALTEADLGVPGVPVPFSADGLETMSDPNADLPFHEWANEFNQAALHEFSRRNELSTVYLDCTVDLAVVSDILEKHIQQQFTDHSLGLVRLAARLRWVGGIMGADKDRIAWVASDDCCALVDQMEESCLRSGRGFSRLVTGTDDEFVRWVDVCGADGSMGVHPS